MPIVTLTTYKDAVQHVIDFLGGTPSDDSKRDARRAILNAYREVAQTYRWSYFYQRGRINTVAMQTAGTIQYQDSSGSSPRLVTLTGATWPTNAFLGCLAINNIRYEIDKQISSTQITLTPTTNPGADVAAGTAYTYYQDAYVLPTDFYAMDSLINMTNLLWPEYVHPADLIARQRLAISPATPRIYTVMGSADYMGAMQLVFFPPPDNIYRQDYIYQRKARPLFTDEYGTGTVTVDNSTTTVVGNGSVWTTDMIGSVIRIAQTATKQPFGQVWSTPYYYERSILGVTDATHLTVDAVFSTALSGVNYIISDPLDLEEGAMMNCFFRAAEKQAAISRRMFKELPLIEQAYKAALIEAREADSRNMARRSEGSGGGFTSRLSWMPRGNDIT